jgi:FKBP-type peptidyl-prolyl cis-trans isomerase
MNAGPGTYEPGRRRIAGGLCLLIAGMALVGCKAASPRPDVAAEAPQASRPEAPPQAGPLQALVAVDTSLGAFVLRLDAEAAPVTVLNFVAYVEAGFFDGTLFHRVTPNVIQGGAYTLGMQLKLDGLRDPIPSEWPTGIANRRLTIGIVRRPGVASSAQAEFYINLKNNTYLDEPRDGLGYTAFGEVVSGSDAVDQIARVSVAAHPDYANGMSAVVPRQSVVIRSMRLTHDFNRDRARAIAEERESKEQDKLENLVTELERKAGTDAVRTASGVIYVDFNIGTGALPNMGSTVSILYRAMTLQGLDVDKAVDEPLEMEIGTAIPGLREGLLTMVEGGKRTVIVPPELAYGSGGIPGVVPPNSTMIYEIDLLEVN